MAGSDNEVRMMMSVYPGAMTGFAALQSGLVSINNVFMAMTRSMDQQFGLINTAIVTTGTVVTQLGIDAMNAFGEFEQGMKIVQMVSGQTTAEMNTLKQAANDFSVSYRMDIDQITEGLQTLGRAGLNSASEQSEVLKNGLNTAKLEGRDLNGVLEELIQNTALLGGNLKDSNFGEDSQYVNDLLVATSMTAPITTHDISETLKYSGGIAAAAGAQIRDNEGNANEKGKEILEDYMGAIAAFAQKGVTGSIAGTALRAFFNKPATQDSSVTEALASIKLKPEYLWEDDEETMKPVSQQIGIIQKQMDKLNISTMDRLQIWSKIVGGKMGQQMMKLDSESIKDITKDIRAADDATSLAQKSMQTYQANIKEVGEMGARLQRNVGGNLVQIANPILDIIVKIMEFAQSDVMSWPITFGIISFIGLAGKKIMGVLSAVKAELGTLMRGLNAGLTYFTQKGGVVGTSPPRTDSEKEAARKAERNAYRASFSKVGEKSANEVAKDVSKMTLSEYNKHISQKTKGLTIGDYQKMGVSDANLKMMAKMQTLTKDSFKLGISDKQFAEVLGKTGVLTKDQLTKIQSMSGARTPFDTVFGKNKLDQGIAKQIAQNELAVKEFEKLGVTLTQLGIVTEEENTLEKQSSIVAQAHATALGDMTTVREAEQELIKNEIAQLKTYQQQLSEMEIIKRESANKEVEIEQTKQNQILSTCQLGGTKVIEAITIVAEEAAAVIRANAIMPGRTGFSGVPVIPKNTPIGGVPSSIGPVGKIGSGTITFIGPVSTKDNIVNPVTSSLSKTIADGITKDIKRDAIFSGIRFNNFTNGLINQHDLSFMKENQFNNLKNLKNQHDISSLNMGNPLSSLYITGNKSVAPNQPIPFAIQGVGSLQGLIQLVTKLQIAYQQEIQEIFKKIHGEATAAQEEAASKQVIIETTAEEVSTKQAEIDAIATEVDAIARADEAFVLNAQAVDRMTQAANVFVSVMTGKWPMTPGEKAFNERVWGIGKNETDKKNLKDVENKSLQRQREAGTEADRQRFRKERENSMLVSQKEAQRFRDQAKANANYVKSFSGHTGQVTNIAGISQALGKYGNQIVGSDLNQQTARILNENQDVLKRIQSNPRIVGTGYANNPLWNNFVSGYGTVGDPNYKPSSGFGRAFAANLSDRLNRNRAGSFLSFGNTMVDGVMRSATKGLSGFANKALNATEAVGGPFMIAIMAASFAIQAWQKAFEDYCNELKEAGDKLKEAYSNWNTAEEELEDSYKNANPDATQDEIEQMVLDTYSTMNEDMMNAFNNGSEEWFKKIGKDRAETPTYEYNQEKDDGSVKLVEEQIDTETQLQEAIKSNTGALYEATSELNTAMSNYIRKGTDSWWGINGWTGQVSDFFGQLSDSITHKHTFAGSEETGGDNRFDSNNSKYSDDFEFLLTARQKDENYAGYTGMSGLMLQNWKDTGPYDENSTENFLAGLQTMMGTDAITLRNVMSDGAKQFLDAESKFAKRLTQADNLRIQQSMKNDSKTWKSLAKEIAKTEKKTGKKVDEKNKTKKIEGLIDKLNTSMGGHFSDTQILQAAYLTEMEGMLEVAKSTIVPIITQQAQLASQIMYSSLGTEQNVLGTGNSTYGTEQIASVIAAMVSQIALAQSAEATYNAILMQNPDDLDSGSLAAYRLAQDSKDANDFLKKAANASYSGGTVSINWGEALGAGAQDVLKAQNKGQLYAGVYSFSAEDNKKAMNDILTNFGMVGKMMNGWSRGDAQKDITKAINDWRDQGASSQQIYESLSKNFQTDKIKGMIEDAYINSGEEEEGTGSGSGSGSGSGDKDKNTGNRKERVDLVLCNKKEIPKLNVNLFKKPPTFTVLNKNFKVRDVKINTEDTPKAIMSSIKNAFIDVQKRSDPKIIQDESAEYDPVAATDGNSLPSGTSKPNTS